MDIPNGFFEFFLNVRNERRWHIYRNRFSLRKTGLKIIVAFVYVY